MTRSPTLNALGTFHSKRAEASPGPERVDHLRASADAYGRSAEIEAEVSGEQHPFVLEALVPQIEVTRRIDEAEVEDLCQRALGIRDQLTDEQQVEEELLERLGQSCEVGG